MNEGWMPKGRDLRTLESCRLERKFERRTQRRELVKQFQSPCPHRHSAWLGRGSEFFDQIKIGLIRLLRYFGIDTDEDPYRAVVNAQELQIVRRGRGCSLWWHGSQGWWCVGLNPHNHLAALILSLPS